MSGSEVNAQAATLRGIYFGIQFARILSWEECDFFAFVSGKNSQIKLEPTHMVGADRDAAPLLIERRAKSSDSGQLVFWRA
ncbi:MAG TPA: hypothetical protein VGV37_20355 [Aliidongia sp.]|uniref:hypothetical protein n=1 Tax=Aliidongia sp. TaxID=1914230 RepID=UPI002DDCC3EC|nr:hypothetical protein [Aliidongia sp.]HEV2676891.1 hypothetical protein [Aliidongia sp.]